MRKEHLQKRVSAKLTGIGLIPPLHLLQPGFDDEITKGRKKTTSCSLSTGTRVLRWNPAFLKNVGMGLASLLLLSMSSCAGRKYTAIDHRAYSKMPTEASSAIWRGIAKSNSYSSKNAFHGNWGGSGNHGGKPIDSMDEIFRRHDIVYYESRCGKHLKEADRALIKCLKAIDADTLNPQARKYRRIALNFMNSPMSYLVGKPLGVMMRNKEHENCYFTSPEVVTAFFETEHNGFPYAPEEKEEILTNVPQFLIADASPIHSHPTR